MALNPADYIIQGFGGLDQGLQQREANQKAEAEKGRQLNPWVLAMLRGEAGPNEAAAAIQMNVPFQGVAGTNRQETPAGLGAAPMGPTQPVSGGLSANAGAVSALAAQSSPQQPAGLGAPAYNQTAPGTPPMPGAPAPARSVNRRDLNDAVFAAPLMRQRTAAANTGVRSDVEREKIASREKIAGMNIESREGMQDSKLGQQGEQFQQKLAQDYQLGMARLQQAKQLLSVRTGSSQQIAAARMQAMILAQQANAAARTMMSTSHLVSNPQAVEFVTRMDQESAALMQQLQPFFEGSVGQPPSQPPTQVIKSSGGGQQGAVPKGRLNGLFGK